jgi:CheY-like chemotaxis protein
VTIYDKLNVLELLMGLINEHENKLDSILEQMEIIEQTIQKNPRLLKSIREYNLKTSEETSSKNILIVDDDEKLANSFKLILESVGYNVDTVYTGLNALYKINQVPYDLVLLDLNLPDMMGYEVADEIKDSKNNTEIVFITGYSSLKENQNETLLKPIKPQDLIDTAEKVLKKTHS